MADERIGLLGGTFDPPHRGHAALAVAARDALDLDRLLFVVAGDPWQKHGDVVAGPEDRVAMAEALASRLEGCEVSRLEVDRAGPTFTADTVLELATLGRELFLVVGADVAATLGTWDRVEVVREHVTVAVAGRLDEAGGVEGIVADLVEQGWRAVPVPMEAVPFSSTGARAVLARGEVPDDAVPPEVMRVIERRGLYTRRR